MPLQVLYENKDAVAGKKFEVAGLGELINGTAVTLTEDQERSFAAFTGKTVVEALLNDPSYNVTGSPLATGDSVEVAGFDPADLSSVAVVGESLGDTSPATSVETDTPVEVSTPAPAPIYAAPTTTSSSSFTPNDDDKEGGDE